MDRPKMREIFFNQLSVSRDNFWQSLTKINQLFINENKNQNCKYINI